MESFAHPSIKVAAGVLALISLAAFGVGFKESFVRPGEPAPAYHGPAVPASGLGEPTTAQALTEPVPISAAEPAPAPSSAAPKSASKPKPAANDDEDAAADQLSSAKPKSSTPASSAPPRVTPPPASAAPPPDTIDDLLPPH